MKTLLATLFGVILAAPALAGQPDCLAVASEKRLAGAAKNSFMKKCQSGN